MAATLPSSSEPFGNCTDVVAHPKHLNKLAEETGGKAFYPRELSEVQNIAQQISTDLRTQDSIGYYPTNTKKDGSFRSVKVHINADNRRLVAPATATLRRKKESVRASATGSSKNDLVAFPRALLFGLALSKRGSP